jgi:hypothetical protein
MKTFAVVAGILLAMFAFFVAWSILINLVLPFWWTIPVSIMTGVIVSDVLLDTALPWLVKRAHEKRHGEA